MLINIWPRDCNNHLERMNMKVDEENSKYVGMVNGRAWKVSWFSSNGCWKKIGCLISAPNFGLGGSRLWDK